jgi:hypothetical protein
LSGTFREQRIFLIAIRFLANDLRLPLFCDLGEFVFLFTSTGERNVGLLVH